MAARLARSKATVQIGGAEPRELHGVSVVVRNEIATVRLGSEILVERGSVARVVPLARRSWQLHFDGTDEVWTVTDERRACCGRR